MKYEIIIGLEFHVQLKTKTKMFCSCANEAEPKQPNTNICPICLGHPGTLPTVNEQAMNWAIKAALALNCQINLFTKFDRKNYFYPDSPKGYQISQYDKPLAENGYFDINISAEDSLAGDLADEKNIKHIKIIRLHVEEDSAKSIHEKNSTLIDYNRASSPLIEIVTGPDFSSAKQARAFAQELQLLMRHLEISNADMEKAQLRCDANISLRPQGDTNLYPKIEIKNINSFKSLEKALAFEIKRQKILWEKNKPPKAQETRGWDDSKQQTVSQRTKESQADYRYFPEPDLPPLTYLQEQIDEIKSQLPELPQQKRFRFVEMYGFSWPQAKILTTDKQIAEFTEQIISELKEWLHSIQGQHEKIWEKHHAKLIKLTADWLINKLIVLIKNTKTDFSQLKITAENFAELLTLIYEKKVTSTNAQKILEQMYKTGADPSHVMADYKLGQIENIDEIKKIISQVINDFPQQVAEFKAGKQAVFKFLLGQIMQRSQGKANPQIASDLLKEKLK